MKNKKTTIIYILLMIIIIISGILVGVYLTNNEKYSKVEKPKQETKKENKLDSLTDIEKEIAGINEEKENFNEEERYSDLYKEYLEIPEEERENIDVIPREEKVPFEILEDIKEDQKEKEQNNKTDKNDEQNDEIPERFHLGEIINIKVEDQGMYGLCWDFASLKTLETYLALNNLGNYDFSELHLDYIESDLLCGNRLLHDAGNFAIFKDYNIESGVILEADLPYSYRNYTEEEYNKFLEKEPIIQVTETIDFPSIYKIDGSEYTEEELSDFRETVKRHIMTNGALYTCIVGTAEKNHYTAKDTNEWTNHAVAIVGWDDKYSKENFLSSDGKIPEKDGAYIALNSWGTYHNDGGYYYISYEDKFVESNLSGVTSVSMDKTYKISSIENKEIRNFLIDNYSHVFMKYQEEDYISKNALSRIYELDLSNKNLTSIDGIEIFTNLSTLNLSNNQISDLSPLEKMTNLYMIDLSNNQIKDIKALEKIKNLSTLILANNQVSDLSAILNLKNLWNLDLSGNNITDISILAQKQSEEYISINLNLSNNPNMIGVETLANVVYLNLSNCNISDVSNLNKLDCLVDINLSNNPEISGLEFLPEKLRSLDISNCELEEIPELPQNITWLNIANNKIMDLDKLPDDTYLKYIELSENLIEDWSRLKEISYKTIEEEIYYEDEHYYEGEDAYREITFIADNCNIEDITIFNDLPIQYLQLKNNIIKDISGFRNETVCQIDLSNNNELRGLESLSLVDTAYLNNCNLTDLEEVLKLKNVVYLSLEDNNLKDITDITKLEKLKSVSFANNQEIKGNISSDKLETLNLNNCNIDNKMKIYVPNLYYLNLGKNPNFSEIEKILENSLGEYLYVMLDELEYFEYMKLYKNICNNDKYIYINVETIILEYNLVPNTNEINLDKNIKLAIANNMLNTGFYIRNGYFDRKESIVRVEDLEKESVDIKFTWGTEFDTAMVRIIFNKKEEFENTLENNISNVISNTISNTITDEDKTENMNVIQHENVISENIFNKSNTTVNLYPVRE